MRKKASIVVGLGYGDEGKGLTTDFLCGHTRQPLVIRYNGGHQAGHTVLTQDGHRHVFSSFGAGTLRHVPTYWSRYCTFSPAYLLYELEYLPVPPKLYVDRFCPVTTHYDVLYNRRLEIARDTQRLGSCGVGFGATIDRHFGAQIQFFAGELLTPSLCKQRLKQVKAYYKRIFEKDTGTSFNLFHHDEEDLKFLTYTDELHTLMERGQILLANEESIFQCNQWENYIFEGAQGILLDRTFGNQPFITKSNTTTQNALELLRRNNLMYALDIAVYYVSRCYLTRHGGGPFLQFSSSYELKNTENETNVSNEFQGELKKGVLNLNLMRYALSCDSHFSANLEKNLILTCLDQLPDDTIHYTFNDNEKATPIKSFPQLLNIPFHKVRFNQHPCGDRLTA